MISIVNVLESFLYILYHHQLEGMLSQNKWLSHLSPSLCCRLINRNLDLSHAIAWHAK